MSFAERDIQVTITLGGGIHGQKVVGQRTLKDLRVECSIAVYGGYAMGELQARIYGLSQDATGELTTTGTIMNGRRYMNRIRIDAGNKGSTLSTVYTGSIQQAYADYQQAPEVCLMVLAHAGGQQLLKPSKPTSIKGSIGVATLMSQFAQEGGFGFVDAGVKTQIKNPYYTGSVIQKIRTLMRDARINAMIHNNTLYIWPLGGFIPGHVPVISPDSGMVGYPTLASSNIVVKNEFLPTVLNGNQIKIEHSSLNFSKNQNRKNGGVNGVWNAYQVVHEIASQTPNGPWFTTMKAFRPQSKNHNGQ